MLALFAGGEAMTTGTVLLLACAGGLAAFLCIVVPELRGSRSR